LIVVHDPVGVRGTLPASFRIEEAGFRLLGAEEAFKGSRNICGAAMMFRETREVQVANL
jgi:hypothetical protein